MNKNTVNNKYELEAFVDELPCVVYFQNDKKQYVYGSKQAKLFLKNGVDKSVGNRIDIEKLAESLASDDDYVLCHKKQLVLEKMAVDVDGKEHFYSVEKSPVLDKDDNICGIATVVRNIDEEKEKERRQGTFVAMMSHDLKNILQAQIRSLELMGKGLFGEISETQKEMLDMTLESANFMKTLLCSVSRTCRENNGIIVLERTNFNLIELVEICVNEIKALGQEREVCINLRLPQQNEVRICADKTQIRRVFENLLNNVANYAFSNTCINVELKKFEEKVVVSFENNSKEISGELRERIFDKYVSSSRNGFNVGLGLYFCKKIVEAHEGRVFLLSEGIKNKFVVELPVLTETDSLLNEIVL